MKRLDHQPVVITSSRATPDPLVVAVVNGIFICPGYFMIGQHRKGLLFLSLAFLAAALATCLTPLLIPLLMITAAIDVYKQAKHSEQGRPITQWTFFSRYYSGDPVTGHPPGSEVTGPDDQKSRRGEES
ncbi:MAG: hypothetical protein KY432_08585 [Acidobacteria bacterium]|nr:hypothetical protein [Acidobacteriota bacterium]